MACLTEGIEPRFEVADVEEDAAVAFVISANLRRRHDDPSVRAMQVVKLREMLKVANLPSPTLKAAADAGGVSYRTARNAQRVHQEDPELAEEVQKGKLTVNAANEIMEQSQGEERHELKRKVAAAGSKKEARSILGEQKRRRTKQKQRNEFGTLQMPDLTGHYAKLLAVLENIPRLPHELRNLKNARHPLSVQHARQLRGAVVGAKRVDNRDLDAAADEAIAALDQIIARAKLGENVMQPVETGDTGDRVVDIRREAS